MTTTERPTNGISADPAALEPKGGPLPFTGYHVPPGGHPPQTDLLTDRAMFTEAYAGTMGFDHY